MEAFQAHSYVVGIRSESGLRQLRFKTGSGIANTNRNSLTCVFNAFMVAMGVIRAVVKACMVSLPVLAAADDPMGADMALAIIFAGAEAGACLEDVAEAHIAATGAKGQVSLGEVLHCALAHFSAAFSSALNKANAAHAEQAIEARRILQTAGLSVLYEAPNDIFNSPLGMILRVEIMTITRNAVAFLDARADRVEAPQTSSQLDVSLRVRVPAGGAPAPWPDY